MEKEIWKDVVGYKGTYWVSNFGRIKSLKYVKKIILRPSVSTGGYLRVILSQRNIKKHCSVHRIVALAFIPNPENKLQVNHIDGNKLNNNSCNLEWSTCSENHFHAFRNGLMNKKGEKHPQSRLNNSDVLKIRELYSSGQYTQKYLAGIYSCDESNIRHIVNRKNWNHI